MTASNSEIGQALDQTADFLELEDANPFRVRAYRNAARVIRSYGTEIAALLARGEQLPKLRGIGDDLGGKICEIARTGHMPLLDRLRAANPAVTAELLKLPGLGPKRVMALVQGLDIHSLKQLHRAALDGRVRALPGFGPGIEKTLLRAFERRTPQSGRIRLADAEGPANALIEYLKKGPAIHDATIAGSFRRALETVGDLDIVAWSGDGPAAIAWFKDYEAFDRILVAGTTRATALLKSGLQVDLRIVPRESFGAALHYFTGSKAHNIAIRARALGRRLKINEYGVFRGKARLAGVTESEVYASVGLPYIEPELRENRGEIEAASSGDLPDLVKLSDLKGDLHLHSTATDGWNSIREMAIAAAKFGHAYIAVTDHSKRLTMVHGLDSARLSRQIDEIDRMNEEGLGVTILKGVEVDILDDGTLDLPNSMLRRLDLVVAAVHSKFNLSREAQTTRILKALENPNVAILAHPTGRLIGEREPYDVDMPRLIRAAKDRGCFLELNAHPERLDLSDVHCRMAKEAGVAISIATDAHRDGELDLLRFGIGQARRGWLEKRDILNARPLADLKRLLARAMGHA